MINKSNKLKWKLFWNGQRKTKKKIERKPIKKISNEKAFKKILNEKLRIIKRHEKTTQKCYMVPNIYLICQVC